MESLEKIWGFFSEHWQWLFTTLIIPPGFWGWKMIRDTWPLKLAVLGEMTVIATGPLSYAFEPHVRFFVKVRVEPRSKGVVEGVYLRATDRSKTCIGIPLRLDTPIHTNIIKPATRYWKGRKIGPFEMCFEISESALPLTAGMREWLGRTQFKLVIETGRQPAVKTVPESANDVSHNIRGKGAGGAAPSLCVGVSRTVAVAVG